MTLPERRSTWPWWVFYLVAAVLGVWGGLALFDWVSG